MILGLKTISENLLNTKESENEMGQESLTLNQIDKLIIESYNKLKYIKEQVEDVKSQWKSLQEDVECFSFAKVVYQGNSIRESFQKAIDDLKLEYNDTKRTFEYYKNLKSKILTEAETISPMEDSTIDAIKVSSTPLTDNDSGNTHNYIIDELEEMVNVDKTEDILQYLFDELVPVSGKANTFAGELIRAIMDLLYNAKANNYKFYEGEGLARCGSSAQYLKDNGYEDDFAQILNNVHSLSNREYLDILLQVADNIIKDIQENHDYLNKINTIDSRYYDYDDIKVIAPTNEYIIEIPEDIQNLYGENDFNSFDVLRYIKETFDHNDIISDYNVENMYLPDSNQIFVSGLTEKDLEELKGIFEETNFWHDYYDNLTAGLEEDLQILHNTLNESTSEHDTNLLNIFLSYHEDLNNYRNNFEKFNEMYDILDKYGDEDEDVDVVFLRASEDDQHFMIELIRPLED